MMNDYKIRKATTDDLPTIMTLIDASREIMRSNGNLTQWPVGYPAAATVKADIDDGTCYLITDNEKAVGSFALKLVPTLRILSFIMENGSTIRKIITLYTA